MARSPSQGTSRRVSALTRHRESGFTLQEVLVAVNIGFLIVSFSLLLLLSVTKIVGSWQNRINVKNTVNTLANRITIDAETSEIMRIYPDTLLELENRRGRLIRYRFYENRVTRNDMLLNNGEKLQLMSSLAYTQTKDGNSVLKVEVTGKSKEYEYKQAVTAKANPDSKARFN